MFTYNNIMRAFKAGGIPDYWYAQFTIDTLPIQTVGLANRGTVVTGPADVAYPVYLADYDDTAQSANGATYWFPFDTDLKDAIGGSIGSTAPVSRVKYNGAGAGIDSAYTSSHDLWETVSHEFVIDFPEFYTYSGLGALIFFRSGGVGSQIWVAVQTNTLKIQMHTGTSGGTGGLARDIDYTIPSLGLYHVVLTYERTQERLRLYVNGALINERTDVWPNPSASNTSTAAWKTAQIFPANYTNATRVSLEDHKWHRGTELTAAQVSDSAKAVGLYGVLGVGDNVKVWHDSIAGTIYKSVNDGPIETEYTGITADLKPASYDPADTTLDTTSTIATNPDANDWQPYGA